jgi:hypothetical protein
VLTPFDDYPIHQTGAPINAPATGDRNHYDRYFFNGYDRDGSLFFALAMGRYPNRSVIDASFSVVDAGVQRSVHASGRAPDDPIDTSCGPIRVEVVEPLQTLRVVVDDAEHGIGCDLTWRARTVAVEEDRFRRSNGTRIVMDYTRLTQFGTWEGWVRTGDREVAVGPDDFLGSRDRSWGIRVIGEPEGGAPGRALPQFFWLWAPLNFEDGAAHFDVNEDERGDRWHRTALRIPLAPDPDVEAMRAVDWHIDWEPGTRRAERASLTFTPWNQDPSVIELEPILTFQMLGIGYFHPEWPHGVWKGEASTGTTELVLADLDPTDVPNVHVQQLVRARWGDRTGIGVLEQLAIGEHRPSGLTGLFDGAPPSGSASA